MTKPPEPKQHPTLTSQAEADRQARHEREATALRDNLRRRKAQTRANQPAPPCKEPDRIS